MRKHKKILIILILLMAAVIALSALVISNTNNGEKLSNLKNSTQTINSCFYRVACLYGSDGKPDFPDLFGSSDSLQRLKKMNEELNSEFDYWEINFQPLYSVGFYEMSPKFVNSYNETTKVAETINQNAGEKNGQTVYVTDLKTIQMSKRASSYYDHLITSGRNFNDSDFNIDNENDMISIVLGYNYSDYYNLGDIINLTLHQKELSFKVIGFFDKGSHITINGKKLEFDNCIVMPFYNINYSPTNPTDEMYQKIYYSQKNEGYIYSDNQTFDTLEQNLSDVTLQNDLIYSLATAEIHIQPAE